MANSAFSAVRIVIGTANQIVISGTTEDPITGIANNPILPGTAGTTLPTGTTGQRAGIAGTVRFNTTIPAIEGTLDGATWVTLASGAGPILSITGTLNRITVSAGVNPVIDIAATYIGQASITTLGTITTGVWSATAITEIHGGTNQTTYALGDIIYSSAANTLSKLSGNITAVKQYLSQTGTGAVSAAPSWATISGGDITGAALTAGNDTNVTLTTGGTPTTALLRAASITAGWAGQLSLTRGGTNASLAASNGGIVWSNATQMQILAGTATASLMLLSGSTATPTWSTSTIPSSAGGTAGKVLLSDGTNYVLSTPTFPNASAAVGKFIRSDGTNWIASTPTLPVSAGTAGKVLLSDGTNYVESTPTYPSSSGTAGKILRSDGTNNIYSTSTFSDTYTASNLLYSNGANTVTGLATANKAVLTTGATGIPVLTALAIDGQIIIGSTAGIPAAATLTAGANVTITNAGNSITIAASAPGTGTVTSIGIGAGLSSTQTPLTTSGTITCIIPFNNSTAFTANGTFTTSATTTRVFVRVWGGGGAGGSSSGGALAGAGGAAGGYSEGFLNCAVSTGYTITVGTGGAPGGAQASGGNGNTSSAAFTATISATGGAGGAPAGAASTAGTGSGGSLNLTGQSGSASQGTVTDLGGRGGDARMMGCGAPVPGIGNSGIAPPANTGSGGSGAGYDVSATKVGGAGSDGLVIVYY